MKTTKSIQLSPEVIAECERRFAGHMQPLNWSKFLAGLVAKELAKKTKAKPKTT